MSEVYEREPFFLAYVRWHYSQGLSELLEVARNILWFVAHFFSFKLLLSTLFNPWRRLGESYGQGFNLSAFASAFIVNTLMRVIGLATKLLVLGVGLAAYLSVALFFVALFLIWILAPLLLLGSAILSATFFVI